jgi:hypothetical protein
MIDLTGANLAAYIIRVVQDAVARNPRFRQTLGAVTFASNNQVNFADTQVLFKDLTTDGNRLSPDYFMCTQHGRAILCKVGDKEGAFVEWVIETDPTRVTPQAGVYYFNVDKVDEQTRDVNLTVQQYRWAQGSVKNAQGSVIALAPGIDGTTLTASDADFPGEAININAFQKFLILLTPCNKLVLTGPGNVTLVPNRDYWIQRQQSQVLVQTTPGGPQLVSIPSNLSYVVPFQIIDQDGYVLRPGIDYTTQGPPAPPQKGYADVLEINPIGMPPPLGFGPTSWVQLSSWTPAGSTLTLVGTFNLDPSVTMATNPENYLPLNLGPNETLATGQVRISATSGDYTTTKVPIAPLSNGENGSFVLPRLLAPGDWCHWEARVLTENFTVLGKKYELNHFKQTMWDPKAGGQDPTLPAPGAYVVTKVNGQPVDPIPGMVLAIGDAVVEGDQCAIIVNPEVTETYEVFGSKETLSFTLDCKSNDYQTSSDLSELLKRELLIFRRENMEADGITIYEAKRSNVGEQRDPSGTAPRYTFNVSITASADWKVFVPCVTRMVSFQVNESAYLPDYVGKKIVPQPRIQALGNMQFLPSYR